MQRLAMIALAAIFGLGSSPVLAQSFLGRVAGNCVTLPSSHSQLVALDAGVAAGATLVITVATSSPYVSGMQIDDPVGNRYQALGGVSQAAGGALVHFRSALQRSLGAGQVLLLSYDNAGDGVVSCVSVLAYSGIPFGNIVQETLGHAVGLSNTPGVSATAPGAATRKLVLAGVATLGNPGTVSPQAPASVLPTLCAVGDTLCLIDAQYFEDLAGTASVGLTLDNPLPWAAALTSLQADGIFGNGFD